MSMRTPNARRPATDPDAASGSGPAPDADVATGSGRATGGSGPVIRIERLVKAFGPTRALDGLDLDVRRGEIHGFLGPNGAGKSTTLRILLGLLRPDGGEVRLLDGDPWRDAVALHRRLAYVPGDVELWPNLTGGEAIDILARLRGGADPARRRELIERFELDPRKRGRTYSKGNRQKVALVAALSSGAELLLLDEPTSGLDPLMEAVFQQVLEELKDDGRTVLLSSHILAQVERLADRVSIIRAGRIVESGTLDELRHLRRSTVEAVTVRPIGGPDELAGIAGVHQVRVDGMAGMDSTAGTAGTRVRFVVDAEHLDAAMAYLGRFRLAGLTVHPPTLEELMLRHYGDQQDTANGVAA